MLHFDWRCGGSVNQKKYEKGVETRWKYILGDPFPLQMPKCEPAQAVRGPLASFGHPMHQYFRGQPLQRLVSDPVTQTSSTLLLKLDRPGQPKVSGSEVLNIEILSIPSLGLPVFINTH
jgi:hypothetical protein